jgi:hypothetical protein
MIILVYVPADVGQCREEIKPDTTHALSLDDPVTAEAPSADTTT